MTDIYLPNPLTYNAAPNGSPLQRWLYSCWFRITNGIKWSVHNNNVNTVILNNTATQLPFSTIVTDSVGGYSTTTNNYTIQNQGTYSVTGCARLNLTTYGTITGGVYPHPPFAYSENVGKISTSKATIRVADVNNFAIGMAIGVIQDATIGGLNDRMAWYTCTNLTQISGAEYDITISPNVDGNVHAVEDAAGVFGVALPANPTIATSSLIQFSLSIYQNGVAIKTDSTSSISMSNQTLEATKNIECNIGDTLAIYVTQSSGNTQSILGDSAVTYFQGSRIN